MPSMSSSSRISPTAVRGPTSTLMSSLRESIGSRGIEAYLVGGAVRDALVGRETRDIDVGVVGNTRSIAREFAEFSNGRSVLLDESRDIVRVVVAHDGASPYVDFSPITDTISHDLERRDFTIDAMALPLREAESPDPLTSIIDPLGGLPDLRNGLVRSVGRSIFESDPARLLRAPRLAVQLRFEIDQETKEHVRRDAGLVTRVAPERVRDELMKLLAEPGATSSIRLLDDLGLLCRVIPELEEAKGVVQPKEHHWDVFDHLVETPGQVERVVAEAGAGDGPVEEGPPTFDGMAEHFAEEVSDGHSRLTLLKLAGLLHDVAKPASKTVEPTGRIRFLGHHVEGAEVVQRILGRLRFSGRGVELVRQMVYHHLRPGQMAQKGELPTGKAVYRYFRDVGDAAVDTLYLNLADYLAARGPLMAIEEWSEYCGVIDHVLHRGIESKAPDALPRLIDGHDIMGVLSVEPGPKVGELMDLVREAQASGEVKTRKGALELVKANLGSRDAIA